MRSACSPASPGTVWFPSGSRGWPSRCRGRSWSRTGCSARPRSSGCRPAAIPRGCPPRSTPSSSPGRVRRNWDHEGVTANRLRLGALLWLLTLQFLVVETVVQLRWPGSYSRVDDVISDLGTALSPARTLMNLSFVVQGALIIGGALLLGPALRGRAARVAQVLLGIAGLGVPLVGVFPSDGVGTLHAIGAVAHFVGGNVGLIALAYAVRPRSELLGTVLALLGVIGTALTVFFLFGVVEWLGEGGTERGAA